MQSAVGIFRSISGAKEAVADLRAAGIPQEKTAWNLNQLCGSGLRAVALGMQQIANGDADIIVAGGQESMSQAPHAAYLRGGSKMGDVKFTDTMLTDVVAARPNEVGSLILRWEVGGTLQPGQSGVVRFQARVR